MKFPVVPESMSAVVLTILFFVVRWESSCFYCWVMLQVHNLLNGKKMLRPLPSLKIQGSRGGDFGNLLHRFFITDF